MLSRVVVRGAMLARQSPGVRGNVMVHARGFTKTHVPPGPSSFVVDSTEAQSTQSPTSADANVSPQTTTSEPGVKSPKVKVAKAKAAKVKKAKAPLLSGKELAMHEIEVLLDNNKAWVKEKKRTDSAYFDRLADGQAPKYLYIGCSDSRVPANEILGLEPGDVFVHRNVANLMPINDLNSLSVLEYAVDYLDVQHIIVTGHYDCGGIKAALQQHDWGPIDSWLRNIRDVYRLHQMQLDMILDPNQRARRLVELNVVEQCLNLYKTGVVQRKRLKTFKEKTTGFVYPQVHGLVFDPAVGVLERLPLNFKRQLQDLSHIYDLYPVDVSDDEVAK